MRLNDVIQETEQYCQAAGGVMFVRR